MVLNDEDGDDLTKPVSAGQVASARDRSARSRYGRSRRTDREGRPAAHGEEHDGRPTGLLGMGAEHRSSTGMKVKMLRPGASSTSCCSRRCLGTSASMRGCRSCTPRPWRRTGMAGARMRKGTALAVRAQDDDVEKAMKLQLGAAGARRRRRCARVRRGHGELRYCMEVTVQNARVRFAKAWRGEMQETDVQGRSMESSSRRRDRDDVQDACAWLRMSGRSWSSGRRRS